MFKPILRILLKLLELAGCIACVIAKVLTDQESRRIFLRNQKYSREWSLLHNITWSREGSAFASVTYGGYTLIIFLLLVTRVIKIRCKPILLEKIFLGVGMVLFFAMGGLTFASTEQVPSDLQDNAIILGCLSFFVAILFLIDLADPMAKYKSCHTQTDSAINIQTSTQTPFHMQIKELNIPSRRVDLTPLPSPEIGTIPSNGHYFPGDTVDVVHAKTLPAAQQPIFAKVLMPEKKRPYKKQVSEPTYQTKIINGEYYSPSRELSTTYRVESRNRTDYIREPTSDDDNLDRPLRMGFVAQAARMWDRRARKQRGNISNELSTIV